MLCSYTLLQEDVLLLASLPPICCVLVWIVGSSGVETRTVLLLWFSDELDIADSCEAIWICRSLW